MKKIVLGMIAAWAVAGTALAAYVPVKSLKHTTVVDGYTFYTYEVGVTTDEPDGIMMVGSLQLEGVQGRSYSQNLSTTSDEAELNLGMIPGLFPESSTHLDTHVFSEENFGPYCEEVWPQITAGEVAAQGVSVPEGTPDHYLGWALWDYNGGIYYDFQFTEEIPPTGYYPLPNEQAPKIYGSPVLHGSYTELMTGSTLVEISSPSVPSLAHTFGMGILYCDDPDTMCVMVGQNYSPAAMAENDGNDVLNTLMFAQVVVVQNPDGTSIPGNVSGYFTNEQLLMDLPATRVSFLFTVDVPEPGTIALLVCGALGLIGIRWFQKR